MAQKTRNTSLVEHQVLYLEGLGNMITKETKKEIESGRRKRR